MTAAIVGTPALVTGGGNYTAEAGSNRLVVFALAREPSTSATPALSTLTWGGLGLGTGISFVSAVQTSGARIRAVIGYVKEADILSGANALDATWSIGMNGAANLFTCYTLSDVDQSTVIDTTASAVADPGSGVDPLTGTIDVVAGTVQILAAGVNNNVASTPSAGWTEQRDSSDTDYRAVSHYLVSAGAGTVTFGLDFAATQSAVILVASFKSNSQSNAPRARFQEMLRSA